MKGTLLLAVAVVTLSSFPLIAQQSNASADAQESTSASAAGTRVNESGNTSAAAKVSPGGTRANGAADASGGAVRGSADANAAARGSAMAAQEMRPVNGELVGKLDSKSAKAGDSVVVKTKEQVRTADGVVIPKGSRLVGHVTEVQAHGSGSADSRMGIAFDRAELKGGQSFAIYSVIRSVAPPANAMAAGSMSSDDSLDAPMGGSGMGGGARATGGSRGGGGLVGGTLNTANSATGHVASGVGSTAGGTVEATDNLAGSASGTALGGVRGAAGATGSLGAQTTGIPGVMLSGNATGSVAGSASGVLSASKKNVHLDSGTQMTLDVAGAVSR